MPPSVFIFIPLYNAEKYIHLTIESVLQQTYSHWKLYILDDCSTDNSFEIAKKYETIDNRIQVERNPANLGMMGNWNRGVSLCDLDFFVKLDADDIWHAEFLEKSIKILEEKPNVGMVFTKYVNIDDNGNLIAHSEITLPDFAKNTPFSCVPLVAQGEKKMLSYSILRQGLSITRKDVFNKVGAYRYLITPQTQASVDTEFYFRVGCHYDLYCIDETLYYYRIHEASISNTDALQQLSAQKLYEVKYAILQYYYQQKKITRKFFRKNIKDITLSYNFNRSYVYRQQRKYKESFGLILENLWINPLKTIQYYLNRL
jgi:glycosyltransferase involved in cell wall biosynthesis